MKIFSRLLVSNMVMVLLCMMHISVLPASAADPFDDLRAGTATNATADPFADLSSETASGVVKDPFAGLAENDASASAQMRLRSAAEGRRTRSFIKQELYEQLTWRDGGNEPYRRLSYGGELLQRFSDSVKTWGSFNAQLRLVNRAKYITTQNDAEGEARTDWFLEYHNLYFDDFDALDSFLSPEARARHLGRFNFRAGRFYLPSGINLQTDTHGTLLQLSNERNFGFERDWYAGFWGAVSPSLNYDLYGMAGSGYDLRLEGQKGLLGFRLSLANKYLFDSGWEGGISLITGERISKHALMRSPSVMALADSGRFIETRRVGVDARHSRPVSRGTLTMTGEWSAGRDEEDHLFTQLYQMDFLRRDRKLGYSLQYRRFRQEIGPGPMPAMVDQVPGPDDASLIGEVTWYFRNDIGNANLHWLKLNVERQFERQTGKPGVLTAIQYYRYW